MLSLSEDQAYARLDEYIDDAIAQLDPRPTLAGRQRFRLNRQEDDGTWTEELFVEVKYTVEGVPADRHREVLDKLYQHWTMRGYDVLADLRSRPRVPEVQVINPEDGFVVELLENVSQELKISAASPFFSPTDPTPELTTEPDQPDSRPRGAIG